MAKSCYTYRDTNVKRTGTVTVVDGVLSLTEKQFKKLDEQFKEVATTYQTAIDPQPVQTITYGAYGQMTTEITGWTTEKSYSATSYSKCNPEDNYNAKTGLIVASRKTESKLLYKAAADLTNLRKSLETLLETVKDMEDKTLFKLGKNTLSLAKIQNETEVKHNG